MLKLTEALPDGRLRFEQEMGCLSMILQRSSDLVGVDLKARDELRIDPGHRIAIEKLEDRKAKTHVLDEVPTITWEQIGGQHEATVASAAGPQLRSARLRQVLMWDGWE